MIIAVANNDGRVSQHFGHSKSFLLCTVEDGVLCSTQDVPSPGHKPGLLPNFLGDRGVEVIIAGGVGRGALEIFEQRNIEVISGASGDAKAAAAAYVAGDLKSTGAICEHDHGDHHHHHHHE